MRALVPLKVLDFLTVCPSPASRIPDHSIVAKCGEMDVKNGGLSENSDVGGWSDTTILLQSHHKFYTIKNIQFLFCTISIFDLWSVPSSCIC